MQRYEVMRDTFLAHHAAAAGHADYYVGSLCFRKFPLD